MSEISHEGLGQVSVTGKRPVERGSVSLKMHSEVLLLLGWGRAILLQLLHPLIAYGIADLSSFLTQSHGRLRRLYQTVDAMLCLAFGTPGEKDRYCAEASGIEQLLGIPNEYFPRSSVELQQYMDTMFSSGEIAVTETARALAQEIIYPPIPGVAQALFSPPIHHQKKLKLHRIRKNLVGMHPTVH